MEYIELLILPFNLQKIRSQFPMADLKPHEDYIYYLRRNIQKDLPKSRLVSVTDSTAYTRVATHILTLKVNYIFKYFICY